MATSQKLDDTLEQTKLFRSDQGLHECEVTYEGESGLLKQQRYCDKNPGHEKFIPIAEFTQDHLGSHYNHEDIFNVIQTEAALTVRIAVSYTSMARPDNYPFYNFRGTTGCRVGTGWIRWVRDKFTENDNKLCPCPQCKCSPFPKKEWGRVYVRTAQHVVYDTSEAENTQCMLFYDRPEDYEHASILQGVSVTLNIQSDDWSEFSCITHDLSLWDKLDQLDHHRNDMFNKVKRQFLDNKSCIQDQMIIIISHPHGCSKQVSIGQWIYKKKVGQYDYTQYIYTACTCPGSSGAPIYILGVGKFCMMSSHPHSKRCKKDGLNVSGVGWN